MKKTTHSNASENTFFLFILGFGFVTFTDMTSTKNVCSTRIFNLHGRKVFIPHRSIIIISFF